MNQSELQSSKSENSGKARPRVVSVTIKDIRTLQASYMQFLKNGGLFVPTASSYNIGDEVFLVLDLLEKERFTIASTVAWTTPAGAQASRTPGVGIHFKGTEGVKLKERIMELLTQAGESKRATHTL